MSDYIVYFKSCYGFFRVWHSSTKRIESLTVLPENISNFYLPKNYDSTDDDLIRYSTDILEARNELLTSQYMAFDYIVPFKKDDGDLIYRHHGGNIEKIFRMITPKSLYQDHEKITYLEHTLFEKCYNAALTYTTKGLYQSYGYDFSNFYGSILGDSKLMIPTKQGKEKYFKDFPNDHKRPGTKKIYTGFYHCKITINDDNIKKIFAISSDNVYCSTDIKFAFKLKSKGYDINIELLTDVKYNAYIYTLDSLIPSKKIFGRWYNLILNLKKEFPKNILIKMLSSSLWGHLSQRNIKTYTEEEANNMIIGLTEKAEYIIIDEIAKDDGTNIFKLMKRDDPYKYNFRLKPFITSHARVTMAKLALKHIDHVLRIHTDSIVYDQDFKINIENLYQKKRQLD
jgi:hypothetical protein